MTEGGTAAGRSLFDPGLQPERTTLAWRRTGLALSVASLTGLRILPVVFGGWAIIPSSVGLLLALVIVFLSHRRHLTTQETLTAPGAVPAPLPSGTLPALVTVVTLGGGLVAFALVLAH